MRFKKESIISLAGFLILLIALIFGVYKKSLSDLNMSLIDAENLAMKKASEYSKKYRTSYKIFEKLPIESRGVDGGKRYEFKVIGGELPECKKNKEFCIKIIDIEGGGKERALEEIRKLDGNIDSYEIIYDDLSEEIKKYNESLIGK